MDVNQVMKLVEAGYTKAEIEAMTSTEAPKEAEAEKPKEAEESKEAEAENQPTKTPTVEEAYSNMFKSLNKQVEEFSKKLEGLNTKLAEQPHTQERTVEDMIASIVTPKGEKL